MSDADNPADEPGSVARTDILPLDQPWIWLECGWRDFMRAPSVGLLYGTGLVLASWAVVVLVLVAGQVHLLLPLTGGFFIVAPVLVAGLYDTSRRIEQGQNFSIWTALFHWRAAGQITAMGMVLLLIHLAWIRIALLLYPLFMLDQAPGWDRLPVVLLSTTAGLIIGTLVGGVIAFLAFAMTAVSIPMLIDRNISVLEAVIFSIETVRNSPRTMLLWASIIVVMIALAIGTFFIGLAIALPILAHGSWHAYRDAAAFATAAGRRVPA